MNIKPKLDDILTQVEAAPGGALSTRLMNEAIAAILGCPSSEANSAWRKYMKNFAEDPSPDLDRLTLKNTDPATSDPEVRKQVVYMVAYFVCGSITPLTTRQRVTADVIDQ